MLDAADLPDDVAALKAMLIAAQAREVRKDERIERLRSWLRRSSRPPSGASPRRVIPISSIWRLKTWKPPSPPSGPRKKPMSLQAIELLNRERPIEAAFRSIYLASKRSLSRKA